MCLRANVIACVRECVRAAVSRRTQLSARRSSYSLQVAAVVGDSGGAGPRAVSIRAAISMVSIPSSKSSGTSTCGHIGVEVHMAIYR